MHTSIRLGHLQPENERKASRAPKLKGFLQMPSVPRIASKPARQGCREA